MFSIGFVAKIQVEKQLLSIYEEKVAVEAKLGLSIIDEKYPGSWNVREGNLYNKGVIKINDNNKILDKIGETTGGITNIFLNDFTVATNIEVNGERKIGASANPAILEAVLQKGEVYIGKADISGKLYLTMYQPIKDGKDNIIGMWLTGTPIESIQKNVYTILIKIVMTIAVIGIITMIVMLFLIRSIIQPIKLVNNQLKEIAEGEGDLTKEIQIQTKDEIGEMALSFNKMLGSLRAMLSQVSEASEQVAASSEELLSSSEQTASVTDQVVHSIQEVAKMIEIQGKNTTESAEAIHDITRGMHYIADSIRSVAENANVMMVQANLGNTHIQKVGQVKNIHDVSSDTLEVMKNLEQNSNYIGKIIDVITEIASQINLLALNAAIEAARAGEHGKGFAVVADEVRKLAEQSKSSADQIVEIIHIIQKDIDTAVDMTSNVNSVAKNGLEITEESGKSFEQIVKSIENVTAQTQELNSITEEITTNIEQINSSIEEIAKMAETNAKHSTEISSASEEQLATMEEVTTSATTLATMAEQLQLLVKRFKI
ncbi:methyl-accepting chemotaxis protein [Ureibacillus thermosphaericus]|uniref:methyl-accepting chemotaxis protein n=1 Tax=Ureibacillus thermosphaericus TaxID=51173 RepID=UPI0030C923B9